MQMYSRVFPLYFSKSSIAHQLYKNNHNHEGRAFVWYPLKRLRYDLCNFFNFVICDPCQSFSSLSIYDLLLFLCFFFSILVNYFFQVSFNLKVIFSLPKIKKKTKMNWLRFFWIRIIILMIFSFVYSLVFISCEKL